MNAFTCGQVLLSLLALGLGTSAVGCGQEEERARPAVDAPPQAKTPDRLPPGDLLEGPEQIYGFRIPRAMRLDAKFPDRAYLIGEVDQGALTRYVKDRVLVAHVQVEAQRYVFPKARIRGAGDSLFRLEIQPRGTKTRLLILPIKEPEKVIGASDEDLWKRAGLRPDGSLIDPQNLE